MPMTGDELRGIRAKLGLTLVGMAELIGVHWNTIARWERDEVGIPEPAARLARILSKQTQPGKRKPR